MLVFEERGKPAYLEKTSRSKGENQQRTSPIYGLVEGTTLGPPANANNIIFNKVPARMLRRFIFACAWTDICLFVCFSEMSFWKLDNLLLQSYSISWNFLQMTLQSMFAHCVLISCSLYYFLIGRFSSDLDMKTREQNRNHRNGNRAIWLVYRIYACGFWLFKRTRGWETFPDNFLEISRYFTLTS